MSKLLNLQQWVLLGEAADHLSRALNESVGVGSVLRLALGGHLQLSIRLAREVEACLAVPVELDASDLYTLHSPDGVGVLKIPKSDRIFEHKKCFFQIGAAITDLAPGIWDLPMAGRERSLVDSQFFRLSSTRIFDSTSSRVGVLFQSREGDIYEVQREYQTRAPARNFPAGSAIVVRVEAISDFIESVNAGLLPDKSPEAHRARVIEVVAKHNGNQTHAAKELGISRSRVGQLIKNSEKADRKPLAFSPQDPFGIAKKPPSNRRS